MHIEDVSDLDWYIDHVVVPSGPELRPVGPVRAWQSSWDALAHRLGTEAGADAKGDTVRLALTQGFVLTREDVRRCGVPDAEFRRLVRRGEWRSVGLGCVTVAPLHDADPRVAGRRAHALQAAAAALKRRGHVIAGASAAILDGLPVLAVPEAPELTAGRGATAGRLEHAHVRRRHLDASDTRLWFGVPAATVASTIVDVARSDARSGLMAADAALHEGVVSTEAVDEALQRPARLPGMRRAREVLAFANPLIESPLESLTHLALHESGLPPPELQRWVRAADGRRYRLDFLWPKLRLALEADERWLRELMRTRQSR